MVLIQLCEKVDNSEFTTFVHVTAIWDLVSWISTFLWEFAALDQQANGERIWGHCGFHLQISLRHSWAHHHLRLSSYTAIVATYKDNTTASAQTFSLHLSPVFLSLSFFWIMDLLPEEFPFLLDVCWKSQGQLNGYVKYKHHRPLQWECTSAYVHTVYYELCLKRRALGRGKLST